MHVKEWTRWQGEDSSAALHPFEERGEDDVYGNEPLAYATYSEEEARRAWPELFAALGRNLAKNPATPARSQA